MLFRSIQNALSLGFLIFPRYSGIGLLSYIMPYLLKNLEDNQDFEWFHLGTSKKNLAMRKVAIKSGFKVIEEELVNVLFEGSNQKFESDNIQFLRGFDAKTVPLFNLMKVKKRWRANLKEKAAE